MSCLMETHCGSNGGGCPFVDVQSMATCVDISLKK